MRVHAARGRLEHCDGPRGAPRLGGQGAAPGLAGGPAGPSDGDGGGAGAVGWRGRGESCVGGT